MFLIKCVLKLLINSAFLFLLLLIHICVRQRVSDCDQRLIGAFNQIGKENQTTQHQDKHIVNLTSARSLNFTLQSFTKIKLASISLFLANILLNFIFKDFYLNQLLSYIKYGLSNLFEKKKLGMSAVTIFQVPDEDLPINSTSVGNLDNSKCQ